MKLIEAKRIAVEIFEKLQPHCERIAIGGSIRREKEEVGGIVSPIRTKRDTPPDMHVGEIRIEGGEYVVPISYLAKPPDNVLIHEGNIEDPKTTFPFEI